MGRESRRDRTEPLCRLVKFAATDGVELSGLLYEPLKKSKRAAIFLHGSGGASVFDSVRTNVIASGLVRRGIAYLPFNNRGAHLIRRLRQRRGVKTRSVPGGMAHERIRDCVADIDGAIAFLRSCGYREFDLIGHSTGANKIALYDFHTRRRRRRTQGVRHYVLLAGGDDTGDFYERLGPRRFARTLERARTMISDGRGAELAPESIVPVPMSWLALFDMMNPDGDYNVFPFLEAMRGIRLSKRPPFRQLKGIDKPSLVIYGDRDEYCFGDVSRCVEILADAIGPKPNFEFAIMENADHGFSGHEEELAEIIGDWLTSS